MMNEDEDGYGGLIVLFLLVCVLFDLYWDFEERGEYFWFFVESLGEYDFGIDVLWVEVLLC